MKVKEITILASRTVQVPDRHMEFVKAEVGLTAETTDEKLNFDSEVLRRKAIKELDDTVLQLLEQGEDD